jgi:hypothetical protein
MQILQLLLPRGDFYNPANGELIADAIEGLNTSALSLKGAWNHEIIDSPDLFDTQLSEAWSEAFEAFESLADDSPDGGYVYSDYETMLEKFLSDYPHEDWIAFRVRSTVFGCGPVGDVNWYVVEV